VSYCFGLYEVPGTLDDLDRSAWRLWVMDKKDVPLYAASPSVTLTRPEAETLRKQLRHGKRLALKLTAKEDE